MVKFEFIKSGEMFGCQEGVCLKIEPLIVRNGIYSDPVNCYNIETNKFSYITDSSEVFYYSGESKARVIYATGYASYD